MDDVVDDSGENMLYKNGLIMPNKWNMFTNQI